MNADPRDYKNQQSKSSNTLKLRPSPGLTLDHLSSKTIPKNIKLKLKLNPTHLQEKSTKTSIDSYYQKYSQSCQRMNIPNVPNLNHSSFYSNRSPKRTKLNHQKPFSSIRSPTSHIFKSYRCHKYHTDLDFNYLTDQKFFKDALYCGRNRLNTVALKTSSPDKYFYQNNREMPKNRNRYSKSHNWNENVKLDNYISQDELFFDKYQKEKVSSECLEKSQKFLNENEKDEKEHKMNVLSNILDNYSQFSVNSPSKLKIFQNELAQMKKEEYKKENLHPHLQDEAPSENNNSNPENIGNTKLTLNLSFLGENPYDRFLEALDQTMTLLDPIFENLSLIEKVEKFLELAEDKRRGVRLGALEGLYVILKKFQLEDRYKLLILEKVIGLLQGYEIQEELFLVACLEICSNYGPCDILLDNIGLICMFITDFNYPRLQKASFHCLMSLEYDGISTLVELSSKDYQEYQRYILTSLIKTPHIQRIIIIKALLNDVYSINPDRRHSALTAISRMHDLASDPDTLNKLYNLFRDSKIEKIFLSSTLRTCGIEGEKILLEEIRTNKDFSVRVAIASVLSYRLPKYPRYLDIKLDQNDTYCITKTPPGNFCTYYGQITPYVYENRDNTTSCETIIEGEDATDKGDKTFQGQISNQNEYLEVSTRDFLAALQRMLLMNYDHSKPKVVHIGNANLLDDLDVRTSKSETLLKFTQFFEPYNAKSADDHNISQELDERGRYYINEDVIKVLCYCLKDYSTAVRDTAASTLGQIGLPEALLSLEFLADAINDEDVNVKSKAIWALGRVASGADSSVISPIASALQKSNMWKVKCACLYAISQFGQRSAKQALPILLKMLKESAINKQTIAETLVKLGNEGESVLLKLMAQENDSNYKLKSSIAKAMALANINSSNIDFIVECLFKHSSNSSPLVRKSALFSIRVLADKADEKVTYLKKKNVIPFYYEKLLDKDPIIQAYAISCIKSLGPQGELIFIEGLIKDINPTIRLNCAIGLAEMGLHTLRTLLIGLHDENISVRKTVEKVVVEKMNIDDIIRYFGDESKSTNRMSLKIAIRDILDKDLPINVTTKDYFLELLVNLEKFEKEIGLTQGQLQGTNIDHEKKVQPTKGKKDKDKEFA